MSGAGVTAEDLGMRGPRGPVFQGINFAAEPGSLVALEGPSGSGRTCLLLALTGRMRTTAGWAEVGGHRLPKKMSAVREITALGPVADVNDLDAALTVTEQLRERSMLRPYFRGWRLERPAERRARIDRSLRLTGLDLNALPKGPRTTVRNLERLAELRLGVALALLDEPRLLAVDDVELKLSDAERVEAWSLLRTVAASGVTVLAACSQAPEDARVVRTDTRTPATAVTTDVTDATTATAADSAPDFAADHDDLRDAEDGCGDDVTDEPVDTAAQTLESGDTTDSHSAQSATITKEGPGDALAEAGRA